MFVFSFSIKEGVLKEVMGMIVSYRVMVKLIVGGSVYPACLGTCLLIRMLSGLIAH